MNRQRIIELWMFGCKQGNLLASFHNDEHLKPDENTLVLVSIIQEKNYMSELISE